MPNKYSKCKLVHVGAWVSGSVLALPVTGLLSIYGFDGGWRSAFYISGELTTMTILLN